MKRIHPSLSHFGKADKMPPAQGITETFTLPVYWASYLVNGDASGLEDSEQAEIDAWLDATAPGECVDVSEDYEFRRNNDANSLGGDCAVYTFIKH